MHNKNETALQDDIFRIGVVSGVQGRRVTVRVDKSKNGAQLLYRGKIIRNVSVNAYVKIQKGFTTLVAVVNGEQTEEDSSFSPKYNRTIDHINRSLDLKLVGYFEDKHFVRGVRELPLVENPCYLLGADEYAVVNTFVPTDDIPFELGTLALDPTQKIETGTNALFASHIGIFGNTGSGKSYTLTSLYTKLFKNYAHSNGFQKHSRFLLIDFNGEYIDKPSGTGSQIITTSEFKNEIKLKTQNNEGDHLQFPPEFLKDWELWSILLNATEKTQQPFLRRALTSSYLDNNLTTENFNSLILNTLQRLTITTNVNTDRSTPANFIADLSHFFNGQSNLSLDSLANNLNYYLHWHGKNSKYYWDEPGKAQLFADDPEWPNHLQELIQSNCFTYNDLRSSIDEVALRAIFQYYGDIASGYGNQDFIGPLIKRVRSSIPPLERVIEISDDSEEILNKPLTVVSLHDVNVTTRKTIPLLLCKYLYSKHKEGRANGIEHLNIIIDEAHNILSEDSVRESNEWRDYRLETFEEMIKEGRKFGVFITIASQRPHDISPTIISQLHNYFLHRLVNALDIHAIEKAVSYLDDVSFESLPILATGSCVFSGVAAQIPVIIQIPPLSKVSSPNNRTVKLTDLWG